MLIVFWDMKEVITIDFIEKGATVNSALYCQLLMWNSSSLLNYWMTLIYKTVNLDPRPKAEGLLMQEKNDKKVTCIWGRVHRY